MINWKRVWLIALIGYIVIWTGACTINGVIYG